MTGDFVRWREETTRRIGRMAVPFLFQPAIIKAKQSSGKSGVVNKKTRFENNVLVKTYLRLELFRG